MNERNYYDLVADFLDNDVIRKMLEDKPLGTSLARGARDGRDRDNTLCKKIECGIDCALEPSPKARALKLIPSSGLRCFLRCFVEDT